MSEPVAVGGMRRGPNGTCELDVGSVIGGRYRLVRFIGRGAMGVVFEAEHLIVGRRLAVKVLSHEWAHDPSMGSRFRAEARAASAAGHPNIVEVFDAGELDDGRPYLVMEFLEGREALQMLREDGPLEVVRACRMIRDVAKALHVAHEVGIVHRDLKAENVFVVPTLDGGETVKVLDFGIATRGDLTAERMTTPGVAVGTPEYMAPEQAFGARPTPQFDIYAIGVLLYELLTGAPPFMSDKPVKVLGIKASTPAPSVSEQRSDLPDALVTLVAECLEIDPDERPSSAAEIAERLEAIVAEIGRPVPLAAIVAPRRVQGWAVAGATMVAFAAVVVMFAFGLMPEPMPIAATGGVVGDVRLSGFEPAVPRKMELRPAPVEEVVPEEVVEVEVVEEPAPAPSPTASPSPSPRVRSPKRVPAVPVPATPSTSKRSPDPVPAPTSGASAHTAECELDRRRATEARQVHDWAGTLRHTADKSCWSSMTERKRLRVQALMELGRWSACTQEAAGTKDPKIERWATICGKRLEE